MQLARAHTRRPVAGPAAVPLPGRARAVPIPLVSPSSWASRLSAAAVAYLDAVGQLPPPPRSLWASRSVFAEPPPGRPDTPRDA
jgi:hypothetical protein